jgi:amidase
LKESSQTTVEELNYMMMTTKKLGTIPSLLNITLDELSAGLDRGTFTAVDLVETYLARIKEVNDYFKAVIEVNPDALKIASQLDEEMARSKRRRYA